MLPSCPAASAKFPSAQSELGSQWNTQTLSQPNPGLRADETPCTGVRNTKTLSPPHSGGGVPRQRLANTPGLPLGIYTNHWRQVLIKRFLKNLARS